MIDKRKPNWQSELKEFIQNDIDGRYWFEDMFIAASYDSIFVSQGVKNRISDMQEEALDDYIDDAKAAVDAAYDNGYDEGHEVGYESGYNAGAESVQAEE
jgi:flagellar biosynthesis/type III secretory pathway protein FliH